MSHAEERMSDAQDGPPRRPETTTTDEDSDDATPAGQGSVLRPEFNAVGARKTQNVDLLVMEAKIVADGGEPKNAAIPMGDAADEFYERINSDDEPDGLEAAWKLAREDA
jgi:hypothetical protein